MSLKTGSNPFSFKEFVFIRLEGNLRRSRVYCNIFRKS